MAEVDSTLSQSLEKRTVDKEGSVEAPSNFRKLFQEGNSLKISCFPRPLQLFEILNVIHTTIPETVSLETLKTYNLVNIQNSKS